jgi:SAM-dependent methyltransferase
MDRELICPLCRVSLAGEGKAGRRCRACGRHFPVVAGILDLRIAGDAYLSLEEDREKALGLAAVRGGFVDVVRAYWARTPEVPSGLADRYARSMLDGPRRAEPYLRRIGVDTGTLLDVGCGTGGLLVAAAAAGMCPVGVDIALRWLVVASRALEEQGLDAELIAADGALLPYPRGAFDVVTCIETLEHAVDPRALLHGCLAAALPGGTAYVVAANRFSLAPEPSIGLWGVGWLPRRLAVPYVARRRHTRYQHFHPTSVGQLRTFLGPSSSAVIRPAPLPRSSVTASRLRRAAQRATDVAIRRAPSVVGPVVPYLEVMAR